MNDLIKINEVINMCLRYKTIKITVDNKVSVNYNYFDKKDVNNDGIFIGEKYKKFMYFFKMYTHEYEQYIWALTESPCTMSYSKDGRTYMAGHFESVLKSAMELEAYKIDAKRLIDRYKLAWENLDREYKILDDLKRLNNIK